MRLELPRRKWAMFHRSERSEQRRHPVVMCWRSAAALGATCTVPRQLNWSHLPHRKNSTDYFKRNSAAGQCPTSGQ